VGDNDARETSVPSGRPVVDFDLARVKRRKVPPFSAEPLRPQEVVPGHRALTDLGNAERFLEQHGEDFLWVPEMNSTCCWDGKRWAEDSTRGLARQWAGDVARSIWTEVDEAPDKDGRKLLAKHATRSENDHRIRGMLAMAEPMRRAPVAQFDNGLMLLNLLNGIVDLRDGVFLPHTRDAYCTRLAPVNFNPDAECPRFLKFLFRIFADDEDLISFVIRFLGYCLTANVNEHKLAFFYGGGRNGKSTLIGVLTEILGDYARPAPAGFLMASKHPANSSAPSPDQAQLRGRRLVTVTEIARGSRLDEPLVKQLTGGDRISARYLHQNLKDFSPTHKFILSANDKPVVKGTDEGIWSRLLLVPFNVEIPAPERDPELKNKLLEEAPGILALLVKGCLEWQESGLQPPTSVKAASAGYRAEQDTVGRFLEACCVVKPNATAAKDALYVAFQRWCESEGQTAPPKRGFGEALGARGFVGRRGAQGVQSWVGVGILEATDEAR
jgi:putative DNA primase/helicase